MCCCIQFCSVLLRNFYTLNLYNFYNFSTAVYIQCPSVLVSGVCHSGETVMHFTKWCPGTSTTHLAPHTVTTILVTVLPTLHFRPLRPFCTYQSVLPDPLTFSIRPPPSHLLPGNHQSALYVSVSVCFVCLFCPLDSTCNGIAWCLLSLSDLFHLV